MALTAEKSPHGHDAKVFAALSDVVSAARRTGTTCFLDGGTLLGFIRDGGAILGGDADVAVFADQMTADFVQALGPDNLDGHNKRALYRDGRFLLELMRDDAFHPVRYLRYSRVPRAHCDIVILFPHEAGWVYKFTSPRFVPQRQHFHTYIPGTLVNTFVTCERFGQTFTIPGRTEEYLAWLYGSGWTRPDPDFEYGVGDDHLWCLEGREYLYNYVRREGRIVGGPGGVE